MWVKQMKGNNFQIFFRGWYTFHLTMHQSIEYNMSLIFLIYLSKWQHAQLSFPENIFVK